MGKKTIVLTEEELKSVIAGVLKEEVFQGAGSLQEAYDKLREAYRIVAWVEDKAEYGSPECNTLRKVMHSIKACMDQCYRASEEIGIVMHE